ncbi:MAG: 50S ribosomal protein L25/general stress protein Ctc [Betaproteobacteria bacterium]|nr:50S ribosomal protein L25/general stress protein Ctc [Betaproteobacteria bacterium]
MEVIASPRSLQGTGASRRLRRKGLVPGIVYGGGATPQAIELDHNALIQRLRHESFHASVLTMKVGDDTSRVLLRDVQMHPYKPEVLHVDFQRVAKDEVIHVKVPLHFLNMEMAPGVKFGHGVVNHVMNEVDVHCLPDNLPEFIEIDLGEMQLGQSIHLADIKFPAGAESSQLKRGENAVVVTIQTPGGGGAAETEEGEAGDEAAAAATK